MRTVFIVYSLSRFSSSDVAVIGLLLCNIMHRIREDRRRTCGVHRIGETECACLYSRQVGSGSSTVSPGAKTPRDVGQPKTPPRDVAIWPVVDRAITLHNL